MFDVIRENYAVEGAKSRGETQNLEETQNLASLRGGATMWLENCFSISEAL
jgi:hypothetical protein